MEGDYFYSNNESLDIITEERIWDLEKLMILPKIKSDIWAHFELPAWQWGKNKIVSFLGNKIKMVDFIQIRSSSNNISNRICDIHLIWLKLIELIGNNNLKLNMEINNSTVCHIAIIMKVKRGVKKLA